MGRQPADFSYAGVFETVLGVLSGASIENAASRDAMAGQGALDEYPAYRSLI